MAKDPKAMTCVCCKRVLGDASKVLPCHARADGEKREEVWCASCFAYKRVQMEPGRFHAPAFTPVQCTNEACGVEAISAGSLRCSQCGRPALLLSPRECCTPARP